MFSAILLLGIASAVVKEELCKVKDQKSTYVPPGYTPERGATYCFEEYSKFTFTGSTAIECLDYYAKHYANLEDTKVVIPTGKSRKISQETATYISQTYFTESEDKDMVSWINQEHPPEFKGNGDPNAQSITSIPKVWLRDIEQMSYCETEKQLEKLLKEGRRVAEFYKIDHKYQCFHYPDGVLTDSDKKCDKTKDGCATVWWIHLHTFHVNDGYQVDWNMPGSAADVAKDNAKSIKWCQMRSHMCSQTVCPKRDDISCGRYGKVTNPDWKDGINEKTCTTVDCTKGTDDFKTPDSKEYQAGICVSTTTDPAIAAKAIIAKVTKSSAPAGGGGGDAPKDAKTPPATPTDAKPPPASRLLEQRLSGGVLAKVATGTVATSEYSFDTGFIAGASSILLLGALYKFVTSKKQEDVTKPLLV